MAGVSEVEFLFSFSLKYHFPTEAANWVHSLMNFSYVCTYSRQSCLTHVWTVFLATHLYFFPSSPPEVTAILLISAYVSLPVFQLCITGFIQYVFLCVSGFFSFHILCVESSMLFCIAVACSCLNAVSPCLVLKMPLQAFVTTVFFSFIHLKLPKKWTKNRLLLRFHFCALTKCSPHKDHLKDQGSVNSWNI